MNSVSDSIGSSLITVGGAVAIALNTVGSSDAARFVSEGIVIPALASLAPDFRF